MDFMLNKNILDSLGAYVATFDQDLLRTSAGHTMHHWNCNGCSGDCNMSCKGSCGSKYG